MQIKASYSFCKDSDHVDENEDFIECFPLKNPYRFAIADGASTGIYSGIWAKHLVQTYTKRRGERFNFRKFVVRANKKWIDFLYSNLNSEPDTPYSEAFVTKLQKGSFSTFLGLTLFNNKNKWSAIAVGDTCLFQIRDGICIEHFPMERADTFSNTPDLISTLNSVNQKIIPGLEIKNKRRWRRGDYFILASDALSEWFLSEYEKDNKPWDEILDHCTDETKFKTWINSQIMKKQIKIDDISCIFIICD